MVDPPRNNHLVSHKSIRSPEPRVYFVTTLFPNCQLVIDTEACVYSASRSESSFLFEKRLTILCSNTHFILRLQSPKDITKQHGGNEELDRF